MSRFNLLYPSKCSIINKNRKNDSEVLNMSTDKRIIKTRTSIKSAFMELVEEKPISKINVSELAYKALVNRSTFYLHYEDVQAVADDIEREIESRISSCIDDFDINDIYGSTYSVFKKLTNRLNENEKMKKYIVFSTNSIKVIEKIKGIFVRKTKSSILKKFPNISEDEIEYPLIFAAAGVIDSYVNWVKKDSGRIPSEELIREVSGITELLIENITSKAK